VNSELRLDAPDTKHSDDLFEIYGDSELLDFTDEAHHSGVEETKAYVNEQLHSENSGISKSWIIYHVTAAKAIGFIRIKNIDHKNHSGVVGYYLNPKFAAQGFATMALRSCVTYAFKNLNLHRLEAQVHTEHNASIRVLEKCGFRKEGRLIENFLIRGKYRDSFIFGRVLDQDNDTR